jgi:hypothetical protein
MTDQYHRMPLTPAQFAEYRRVVAWMVADAEYAEFGAEFVADEKWRTLTASRLAWNAFRRASDVYGCHVEKEAISAARRDRDVLAMVQAKESVVEVEVGPKSGCLF